MKTNIITGWPQDRMQNDKLFPARYASIRYNEKSTKKSVYLQFQFSGELCELSQI